MSSTKKDNIKEVPISLKNLQTNTYTNRDQQIKNTTSTYLKLQTRLTKS